MADPKHLEILRVGVSGWNAWRRQNPSIQPDLSWTVLLGLTPEVNNFKEVDFSGANLEGAVLSGADLTRASFKQANLSCAKLCYVVATDADFSDANLRKAEIREVDDPAGKKQPAPPKPGLVDAGFAPMYQAAAASEGKNQEVTFAVAWDPEILSESEYAELIVALGDLVRSEGGVGVRRVVNRLFGVSVEAGVLV